MASEWIQDTLTIGRREIQVKRGIIPQQELRFYPDNPRIYSIIQAGEVTPTQSEIEERLSKLDHVKQLVQSILATGGLTDPLIVRDGDLMVLEGNSRLAAYRLLAKLEPIKWGVVKVMLLPDDISDNLVFALLGQYHIIGRQDWQPYEQAGYLYRRVENQKSSETAVANELGLTRAKVRNLIAVYRFMVEHEDNNVDRWSYYEEYLKSRPIKKARSDHPKLDERFVNAVKSGEVSMAIEVRDKVAKVARGGDRSIRIFLSDTDTLDRAVLSAVDRGVDNELLSQFKRFRGVINDRKMLNDLEAMQPEQLNKCLFELGKIDQRLGTILRRFD